MHTRHNRRDTSDLSPANRNTNRAGFLNRKLIFIRTAFYYYFFSLYSRMITDGREKRCSRDELWIFNAGMIIISMSKTRSPAAHERHVPFRLSKIWCLLRKAWRAYLQSGATPTEPSELHLDTLIRRIMYKSIEQSIPVIALPRLCSLTTLYMMRL